MPSSYLVQSWNSLFSRLFFLLMTLAANSFYKYFFPFSYQLNEREQKKVVKSIKNIETFFVSINKVRNNVNELCVCVFIYFYPTISPSPVEFDRKARKIFRLWKHFSKKEFFFYLFVFQIENFIFLMFFSSVLIESH